MDTGHDCNYPGIKVLVEGNKKDIDKIESKVDSLSNRATIVEQSSKSAHHRLDSMEKYTEAVFKLSISVDNMAKKVEEFIEMQKDHAKRIQQLEGQPGQTALKYWHIILTVAVTAIATFVVSRVIK